MAGSYMEAIGCLQECYDRPGLIHHAHIQVILETPLLRNGSGQELRHLHGIITHAGRA